MTVYAGDNNDYVVSAHGGDITLPPSTPQQFNQTALSPPQAGLAKQINLDATQTNTASIWCCPDLSGYGTSYNANPGGAGGPQWQIGYQYFGGIYWWYSGYYSSLRSASPIKLGNSKSSWVLAADLMCKWTATPVGNNPWGGSTGGFVAHKRSGVPFPDGGNHLTVDGSVHWIKFEDTLAITSFAPGTYKYYFYQEDLGSINPLLIPKLKAVP
jgi:hypothetical protein